MNDPTWAKVSWLAVQVESLGLFLCESCWTFFLLECGVREPFRRLRHRRTSFAPPIEDVRRWRRQGRAALLLESRSWGSSRSQQVVFRLNREAHQAASVSIWSSFRLAALAHACHLGMPIAAAPA